MEVKTALVLCAIFIVVYFDGSDGFWRRRRRRRSAPPRVNCAVSGWSGWTICSKTCDRGTQTRSRSITQHPQNGGSGCPGLHESRDCQTGACPCVVTSWSAWSDCSTSCDPGQRHRTRVIVKQPSPGGTACPTSLRETKTCVITVCDCEVSGWSSWGDCTQPCDGGHQTRSRAITHQPPPGGPVCPELEQSKPCNTDVCGCEVSDWGTWGECNELCGPGKQTRIRTVERPASPGGQECPDLDETRYCNDGTCVHCEVTQWTDWNECSKSCDGGNQNRSRTITQHPGPGGRECEELFETERCNADPCPCEVSAWGSWGNCSAECGEGTQERTRHVSKEASDGGTECPDLAEIRTCKLRECDVHCEVSEWGEWGDCSAECGNGTQERTRHVLEHPVAGGLACPALTEERVCKVKECHIHCEVGPWTDFGPCSTSCGPGVKQRTRSVLVQPQHGGDSCDDLTDQEDCEMQPCPVDCQVSKWGSWGNCSAECGEGTQERTRHVSTEAADGGTECPALTESRTCKLRECDVHCEVGPWTDFGPCSTSCGPGVKERTRPVLVEPQHGGDSCDDLIDEEDCDMEPCPVDCKVSKWSKWWDCKYKGKRYCGSEGTQARKRKIIQHPEHGGEQCPELLRERRNCTTAACPHCQVSDWAPWTHCKAKCGMPGKKYRKRTVVSGDEQHECPNLKESLHCTGECTQQESP